MIYDLSDSGDLLVLLCQVVVAPAKQQVNCSNLRTPSVTLTLSCQRVREDEPRGFGFVAAYGGGCIGVYGSSVNVNMIIVIIFYNKFYISIFGWSFIQFWTNLRKCWSATQQATGIHLGPRTRLSWRNLDQLKSSVWPNVHAFGSTADAASIHRSVSCYSFPSLMHKMPDSSAQGSNSSSN